MEEFITPPNHIDFKAKKLFGSYGEIIDGAIAYIAPKGGGPTQLHTHAHDHLFVVVKGEAKIFKGNEEIILKKDQSYLVEGAVPHSIWSNSDEETVMIGVSLKHKE
ncbi:MAG: cupin domain-containing protein [Clostridia bacterium]|nr:cupin domain-containing protein [Clostridia bacterium]